MVVLMWTSSMQTSTVATFSSEESVNMVFGNKPVQKPAMNTTDATNSIETIALVLVAIISPTPKISRITKVASIGSIRIPHIPWRASGAPVYISATGKPGYSTLANCFIALSIGDVMNV